MNNLMIGATVVLTILAATTAQAGPRRVVVTEAIAYDGSELSTDEGAGRVLQRIERTARRLCEPTSHSPLDMPANEGVLRCRAGAVGRAVETLAAPLVTAAYARSVRQAPVAIASR